MKDWANWQEIGFGLAVIIVFVGAFLKGWEVWLKNRPKKECNTVTTEESGAKPMENQILIQLLEESFKKSDQTSQAFNNLTTSILALTETQREIQRNLAQLCTRVETMEDKTEDVVQAIEKQRGQLNEFNAALAVIKERTKKE
jgi:methyl-accepting chemotaxis protein